MSTVQPKDEVLFGLVKNKDFHYYVRSDINEQTIGRRLYRRYFNSPEQVKRFYTEGKRFLRKTEARTSNFKKQIERLSEHQRIEVFITALRQFKKDFDYINDNYSIRPWWALEAWQHDFEAVLGKLIKERKLQSQYEVIIRSLLKPWKPTAIINAGKDVKLKISTRTLVRKYQFMRSWTVVWFKPLRADWFKGFSVKSGGVESVLSLRQVIKTLAPSKTEESFIRNAPYIVFFKDWRDDLRRKHAFLWHVFFEKLAQHFGIPYNDLGYYTLEEMEYGLRYGGFDAHNAVQRKAHEFIVAAPFSQSGFSVKLPVPKRYYSVIVQVEQADTHTVSLKGIIAQTGIAEGSVRLIHTIHDIKKVEGGEILIANTTHPDYLVGMKKAAAFVTDEGGIASHAAIVAREMRKPCIVGTKIATKVFKDGDRVEVNANHGWVRKLDM